ncbi:hypothetical protein BDV06DRAFT_134400 [Aspergillus oleicola]
MQAMWHPHANTCQVFGLYEDATVFRWNPTAEEYCEIPAHVSRDHRQLQADSIWGDRHRYAFQSTLNPLTHLHNYRHYYGLFMRKDISVSWKLGEKTRKWVNHPSDPTRLLAVSHDTINVLDRTTLATCQVFSFSQSQSPMFDIPGEWPSSPSAGISSSNRWTSSEKNFGNPWRRGRG